MENELKRVSLETNTIYMASLAMDLIIRDINWRLLKNRETFKREKKQIFNRFTKAVRDACVLQEMLTQDIYDADQEHGFKNVDIWLDEANELARLILLFADRSASVDAVNEIFSFIRSVPGEGIADEKLLESFYLK